jgi:hypothetical protein
LFIEFCYNPVMSLFGYGFGFSSRATPAGGGGGGPLPGFDFASVGTIEMWLDARDTASITGSSEVSAWANRIAAKPVTSVTQGVSMDRPALVSGTVNGLDALRFGGTKNLFAGAAPVSGGTYYVYVLANRIGSTPGNMGLVGVYDSGMSTGYWNLDLDLSTDVVFDVNGITATTTAHTMDTITPHILWGQQTTASSITAGIDGGMTTVPTTAFFPTTNSTIIGDTSTGSGGGGSGFPGDITIVLVYSALTPMEHISVIGGLATLGGVP